MRTRSRRLRVQQAGSRAAILVMFGAGGMGLIGCGGFGERTLADERPPEETPTWEGEIRALLGANCTRCHTQPPQNGAPDYFRLDKYDREDGDDEDLGAFEQRFSIRNLAINADPFQMPPAPNPRLTLGERAVLQAWIDAGAPRE